MTTRFFVKAQSITDIRGRREERYVEGRSGPIGIRTQRSISEIEYSFEVEDDFEEFMFFLQGLHGVELTQDLIKLLHAVARQKIPWETVCAMLSISLMDGDFRAMGETDESKNK